MSVLSEREPWSLDHSGVQLDDGADRTVFVDARIGIDDQIVAVIERSAVYDESGLGIIGADSEIRSGRTVDRPARDVHFSGGVCIALSEPCGFVEGERSAGHVDDGLTLIAKKTFVLNVKSSVRNIQRTDAAIPFADEEIFLECGRTARDVQDPDPALAVFAGVADSGFFGKVHRTAGDGHRAGSRGQRAVFIIVFRVSADVKMRSVQRSSGDVQFRTACSFREGSDENFGTVDVCRSGDVQDPFSAASDTKVTLRIELTAGDIPRAGSALADVDPSGAGERAAGLVHDARPVVFADVNVISGIEADVGVSADIQRSVRTGPDVETLPVEIEINVSARHVHDAGPAGTEADFFREGRVGRDVEIAGPAGIVVFPASDVDLVVEGVRPAVDVHRADRPGSPSDEDLIVERIRSAGERQRAVSARGSSKIDALTESIRSAGECQRTVSACGSSHVDEIVERGSSACEVEAGVRFVLLTEIKLVFKRDDCSAGDRHVRFRADGISEDDRFFEIRGPSGKVHFRDILIDFAGAASFSEINGFIRVPGPSGLVQDGFLRHSGNIIPIRKMPDIEGCVIREGPAGDRHRGGSGREISAARESADVAGRGRREGSAVDRQCGIPAHAHEVPDDELFRSDVRVGDRHVSFTAASDTEPLASDDLASADRVGD